LAAACTIAGCGSPPPAPASPAAAQVTPADSAPASQGPTETETAPEATPDAAADAATATTTAGTYLEHLVAAEFAEAWALLAPASQAFWGTEAAFAAERAAFSAESGSAYRLSPPDRSAAALHQWLPIGFDGDTARTSVLTVVYPRIEDLAAGSNVFIVAPDRSGTWRIWVAR
jgi:hypothetical protein